MPDLRPLRVGTHRSGNIYYADTPPGSPGGQLGYLNDDAYAVAMVDAFNASLVRDNGLAEVILVDHQRHRGGCLCGWAELGKSFAGHQVAMLSACGSCSAANATSQSIAAARWSPSGSSTS